MEDLPISQTPLEVLGLSARTYHALRRVGMVTIGDALKMVEFGAKLPNFHIPNFGKEGYDELIAKMREKGYLEK